MDGEQGGREEGKEGKGGGKREGGREGEREPVSALLFALRPSFTRTSIHPCTRRCSTTHFLWTASRFSRTSAQKHIGPLPAKAEQSPQSLTLTGRHRPCFLTPPSRRYAGDRETMEVVEEIRIALGGAAAAAAPVPPPPPPLQQPPAEPPHPPPRADRPSIIDVESTDVGSMASSTAPPSGASPAPPPPGASGPTEPAAPPPPPGTTATAGSAASPPPPPGLGFGGKGAAQLMTMMMADPELMKRLESPKVQAALQEVGKSPWKTIKYVFDKEVMEVFGALNNLMRGRDAWTGKKAGTPPPPKSPPSP
eukprot:351771-Chlamydomonas_euryale.AAC.1